MPKGSPKQQTIASKKYQEKAGYISKSYKLKKRFGRRISKSLRERGSEPGGKNHRTHAGIYK